MGAIDPGEALRRECEQVSEVVGELSEEEFSRPTRCPAWNVKELLAHMYRDVERTIVGLDQPPPERADTTAITYWRRYEPDVRGPEIAERAKEVAVSHASGRELAEAWDRLWPVALERAREEDPGRLVATWGPSLELEEFLRTRVVEITVHRADLDDALSRSPRPTPEGAAITRAVLVGLLGTEPPEDLGWDDLAFIEKGTGRRSLSDREREVLGTAADAFPLLA